MCSKERLIVELNNSDIVEGDLEILTNTEVNLSRIVNYRTNNKTDDILKFDRSEVSFAARLLETEKTNTTNNIIIESDTNTVKITNKLLTKYRDMIFNYKLLTNKDSNYYKAIDDLFQCESVCVAGLGNKFDRSERLSLILLSTFKQVYIFDIFQNRSVQFFDNIRSILESSEIIKIMHGPVLYDYLQHKFNFKMRNVFDTQIADSMVAKLGNRSLSKCLTEHFYLPPSLLREAEDRLYSPEWLQRPLSEKQLILASQLVVYLWKLRDHLQKLILKDFYQAVAGEYSTEEIDLS